MSASSVPTIETFIESFPHQVPPMQGVPTYEALNEVKTLLKANAASVPSNRGNGANGYLSVGVSALVYATIDNQPFTISPNPGAHSIIPPGATASIVGHSTVRLHGEQLREWREYTNIQGALLRKQLVTAIEPIYLRACRDRHVGFNDVLLREMLAFLFDMYGQITPQDLQNNQQQMLTPWDPSTLFELLINQIEEAQEIADAGNQPFTAPHYCLQHRSLLRYIIKIFYFILPERFHSNPPTAFAGNTALL
jgi:hypothetical protein